MKIGGEERAKERDKERVRMRERCISCDCGAGKGAQFFVVPGEGEARDPGPFAEMC